MTKLWQHGYGNDAHLGMGEYTVEYHTAVSRHQHVSHAASSSIARRPLLLDLPRRSGNNSPMGRPMNANSSSSKVDITMRTATFRRQGASTNTVSWVCIAFHGISVLSPISTTIYGTSAFAAQLDEPAAPTGASEESIHDLISSAAHPNQNVGALPGVLGVTKNGNSSYSIPLETPVVGTALGPGLSLQYNSGWKQSSVAYGWRLTGLPFLHQCSAAHPTSDTRISGALPGVSLSGPIEADTLCLGGVPLRPDLKFSNSLGDGWMGWATVPDNQTRVIAYNSQRWLIGSDGVQHEFDESGRIFRSQDSSGFINYEWLGHEISEIHWGAYDVIGDPDDDIAYSMYFDYQPRDESAAVVLNGQFTSQRIDQQLTEIVIVNNSYDADSNHPGAPGLIYKLTTRQNPRSENTNLTSVQKCIRSSSAGSGTGICLPATNFTYSGTTPSNIFLPFSEGGSVKSELLIPPQHPDIAGTIDYVDNVRSLDLDGNGTNDLLWRAVATSAPNSVTTAQNYLMYALSGGGSRPFESSAIRASWLSEWQLPLLGLGTEKVGIVDMFAYAGEPTNGGRSGELLTLSPKPVFVPPLSGVEFSLHRFGHHWGLQEIDEGHWYWGRSLDINGDGLPDFLGCASEDRTIRVLLNVRGNLLTPLHLRPSMVTTSGTPGDIDCGPGSPQIIIERHGVFPDNPDSAGFHAQHFTQADAERQKDNAIVYNDGRRESLPPFVVTHARDGSVVGYDLQHSKPRNRPRLLGLSSADIDNDGMTEMVTSAGQNTWPASAIVRVANEQPSTAILPPRVLSALDLRGNGKYIPIYPRVGVFGLAKGTQFLITILSNLDPDTIDQYIIQIEDIDAGPNNPKEIGTVIETRVRNLDEPTDIRDRMVDEIEDTDCYEAIPLGDSSLIMSVTDRCFDEATRPADFVPPTATRDDVNFAPAAAIDFSEALNPVSVADRGYWKPHSNAPGWFPAPEFSIGSRGGVIERLATGGTHWPLWIHPRDTETQNHVTDFIFGAKSEWAEGIIDVISGDFSGDGISDAARLQINGNSQYALELDVHPPVRNPVPLAGTAPATNAPLPDLLVHVADGLGAEIDVSYEPANSPAVSLPAAGISVGEWSYADSSCPTSQTHRVYCPIELVPKVHFVDRRTQTWTEGIPPRTQYMYGPRRIDSRGAAEKDLGISAKIALEYRNGTPVRMDIAEYLSDDIIGSSGALQQVVPGSPVLVGDSSTFPYAGLITRRASAEYDGETWEFSELRHSYENIRHSQYEVNDGEPNEAHADQRFAFPENQVHRTFLSIAIDGSISGLYEASKQLDAEVELSRQEISLSNTDRFGTVRKRIETTYLNGEQNENRYAEKTTVEIDQDEGVEKLAYFNPNLPTAHPQVASSYGALLSKTTKITRSVPAPPDSGREYDEQQWKSSIEYVLPGIVAGESRMTGNTEWERSIKHSYCDLDDDDKPTVQCDWRRRSSTVAWNNGSSKSTFQWSGDPEETSPRSLTTALGHRTTSIPNKFWSAPRSIKFENRPAIELEYDNFGRTTGQRQVLSDGSETGPSAKIEYRGRTPSSPQATSMLVATTMSTGEGSIVEVDSWGRTTRTVRSGFEGKLHQIINRYEQHSGLPGSTVARVSAPHRIGETAPETVYTFDPKGRLTLIQRPGELTDISYRYELNQASSRTIRTDENGTSIKEFDHAGRLVGTMDALETWQCFHHGPDGNVDRQWTLVGTGPTQSCGVNLNRPDPDDIEPGMRKFSYDPHGNLKEITSPEFGTKTFEFDGRGLLTAVMPGDSEGHRNFYDDSGRLKRQEHASGEIIHWTWDTKQPGELSAISSNGGPQELSKGVSFRYDSLGRRTGTTQYFDRALSSGNIKRETLAFDWTFDAKDRISSFHYPKLEGDMSRFGLSYSYDPDSGLLSKVDRVDTEFISPSDGCSTNTGWIFGNSYTLGEVVSQDGLLFECTNPTSIWCGSYEPGTLFANGTWSEVGQCTASAQTLWTLGATNERGQLIAETFGADALSPGRLLNFDEDSGLLDNAVTLRWVNGTLEFVSFYDYAYNTDGRLRSRTDRMVSVATTGISQPLTEVFDYDAHGQLQASWVETAADSPREGSVRQYTYDKFGNLTSRGPENISPNYSYDYEHNNPRALLSVNGIPRQHDERGRLRRTGAASAPLLEIDYDAWGRTSNIDSASGTTRYRYGVQGQRIARQNKTITDEFVDLTIYGQGVFEHRMSGEGLNIGTRVYKVPLPSGSLIQVTRTGNLGNQTEVQHIAVDDVIGTSRVVFSTRPDPSSEPNFLSFGPYGEKRSATWFDDDNIENPTPVNIGFAGHAYTESSGLIYAGARMYDPSSARFISPDPALAYPLTSVGWNAYAYANNSPTHFRDGTGMSAASNGVSRYVQLESSESSWLAGVAAFAADAWQSSVDYFQSWKERRSDKMDRRQAEAMARSGTSSRQAGKAPSRVVGTAQAGGRDGSIVSGQLSTNIETSGPFAPSSMDAFAMVAYANPLPRGGEREQAITKGLELLGIVPWLRAQGMLKLADDVDQNGWTTQNSIDASMEAGGLFLSFLKGLKLLRSADEALDASDGLNRVNKSRRLDDAYDNVEYLDDAKTATRAARSCFPSGTLILTSEGYMPIEQVSIGDLVWSFDEATESWEWAEVEDVLEHKFAGRMVRLDVGGSEVRATWNHPFFVAEGKELGSRPVATELGELPDASDLVGRWVDAADLQVGDVLKSSDGFSVVSAVEFYDAQTEVFNLTVADSHTYAVSKAGLLVHNKSAAKTALDLSDDALKHLSPDVRKSVRSWAKRAQEHRDKLDAYRRNPDAFDNKGILKNAPTPEVRQSIIDGRIRHLENEIRNFMNQIHDAVGQ